MLSKTKEYMEINDINDMEINDINDMEINDIKRLNSSQDFANKGFFYFFVPL